MASVWLIESGDGIDDHDIMGVYSTLEKATLAREYLESGEIVQRTLDPGVDEIGCGIRLWYVVMCRDGLMVDNTPCPTNETEDQSLVMGQRLLSRGMVRVLNGTVWAKHADHAGRIVDEHRVRLISSGEWPVEVNPRASSGEPEFQTPEA
jgi:hypothetical protein